jgi:hypothetical protein
MKTYRFNLGNSNTAQIGAVIRVNADSEEQALMKLQFVVGSMTDCPIETDDQDWDTEIAVYINGENITVEDISEVEN